MKWPATQLRHICCWEYGDSLAAADRDDSGSVPVYGSNGRVGTHSEANTSAPVVVVGRKGSYGKLQYSLEPVFAIDTTFYVDQSMTESHLRWLYYGMSTLGLDGLSQDVGVPGLSRDIAYSQRLPVPSGAEQRRIAEFLDAEMERIDQLVAVKSRMISSVEERHCAEVEAHIRHVSARHSQTTIRRLVTSITQGTSSQAGNRPADEGEWGILKLSAVKNGRFLPSENKVLDGDSPIDKTLRPNIGDLLVTRSNTPAYVGDACAVEEEPGKVLLPDLIYRLVVDGRADARFLSAALRTSSNRHHLSSAARGSSQSMVKLRGEDILNCVVPALPLAEQQAIAASLGESRRKVDEVVAALRDQIALLRERRRSLITAAVTGEMEVA